ncbi:MAG: DUF1499 domain-containing protein [Gemmatimonadetes bacterium]|nr:DUF1499 domain-containing protein [Gemmatimonadota bacterium]
MTIRTALGLLAAVGAWGGVWFVAQSAPVPDGLGVVDGELAPCPGTPNCVRTEDGGHLVLRDNTEATWGRLVELVSSMPRTRIARETDRYIRAEARTAVFRFIDDLELLWLQDSGQVQVRSASRLGAGDLGVNARRLEQLRSLAREAGLTLPPD